jgi:hypothetical protein
MHIFQIPNGRFMYSGQVLEFRNLGINFDTFKLGDSERLDCEQPGNSKPFFDDKFAYLLTVIMK